MIIPRISIITPSYNQGQFIEETILSVINQDYGNLEYLIIDGGSLDDTVSILEKYDAKIDYWVSEPDNGTFDANNKGLAKMTGEYWCILNSDDILQPDALSHVQELISKNKMSWIAGGVNLINERSDVKITVQLEEPNVKTGGLSFATRNWIYHPSTFLHRSVIEEIGVFRDSDIMDYDYWLRMELAGYYPVIVEKILAGLRFHNDCKSLDYINMYRLNVEILKDLAEIADDDLYKEEILSRVKDWRIEYLKGKFRQAIVDKQPADVISSSLSLLVRFPLEMSKRWYWGTLLRYRSGLTPSEHHPYHFMLDEG